MVSKNLLGKLWMIYSPFDISKTETRVGDAVMIVAGWCCIP